MTSARGLCSYALVVTAIGCGGGGGFPDALEIDAAPPPGTFSLVWSAINTGGQPVSCESLGAQSMTALLRNRGVEGGSTQVFGCNAYEGRSEGLSPGTYDLNFQLVGSGGTPPSGLIAMAPAQLGVEIVSGQNVALPPVVFTVDATGGLLLTLTANAAAGNCADVASGGAGLGQVSLTLERASDGNCAPVTFAVGAGAAGTAGTYTVDCTTPVVRGCLEADQTLTATGLTSGAYIVRVRGYTTAQPAPAAACFLNNDSIPVPPLGRTLTRSLNLALQSGC